MNIYDEAIELLNNTKTTVQVEDDSWMGVSEYEIKCVIDDAVYKALERAKKVDELLELYRLKNYNMEDYYTYNSLRGSQKAFDNLKDINEEIYLKEKELEEMK